MDENDDRKERLAKLIRENVRPKDSRSAFDVIALLAPLDAERLKLVADIFGAIRPAEARETFVPSAEGLHAIENSLGKRSDRYERAKERLVLAEIKAREEEGEESDEVTPRYLNAWKEILLTELKLLNLSDDGWEREKQTKGRLHGILIRIEEALGEKSREYIRANGQAHDTAIKRRREEGRENDTRMSLRDLDEWADVLIAELKSRYSSSDSARTAPGARVIKTPRNSKLADRLIVELSEIQIAADRAARVAEDRSAAIENIVLGEPSPESPTRRRRKRPSNVVALKPRTAGEIASGQGGSPKAAS